MPGDSLEGVKIRVPRSLVEDRAALRTYLMGGEQDAPEGPLAELGKILHGLLANAGLSDSERSDLQRAMKLVRELEARRPVEPTSPEADAVMKAVDGLRRDEAELQAARKAAGDKPVLAALDELLSRRSRLPAEHRLLLLVDGAARGRSGRKGKGEEL